MVRARMFLGPRKKLRAVRLTPQDGFSTIEMVVTVAVLMILAAFPYRR